MARLLPLPRSLVPAPAPAQLPALRVGAGAGARDQHLSRTASCATQLSWLTRKTPSFLHGQLLSSVRGQWPRAVQAGPEHSSGAFQRTVSIGF